MPIGLYLPIDGHSHHAGIEDTQLAMPKPLKKRLWQKIVQSKIENQSRVLALLKHKKESDALQKLAKEVRSGDADNREAVAASLYFKTLITQGTRRNSNQGTSLDYGYAILRAGIAREIIAGGWLASRGIHHCNNANSYNLVDDLIEPFRPIVDLLVFSNPLYNKGLSPAAKKTLVEVFEYQIYINDYSYSVQTAIEKTMSSLKQAVLGSSSDLLLLPKIRTLQKIEVKEG